MKLGISLLLVALLVAVDQAVKFLVEANLPLYQQVELLPFLSLFRTYNTGIAFSLFNFLEEHWLIALTAVIMSFVAWLWWRTEPERIVARIGFVLVFGGALGNLTDRIMLGHVVDYILFHTPQWSFAVFNLADSFITVGAALIVLDEFFPMHRTKAAADIEAGGGNRGDGPDE